MELIDEFIDQYEKKFDFYNELSLIGKNRLEKELPKKGIKAIVTNRAKNPEHLREKITKRNEVKHYKKIQDITDDIVDFAGVRVALYFPSDREMINEIVDDLFIVKEIKNFPEITHKPKYNKRFSGYWASHYRVELKECNTEIKRFTNTVFEIQVASVLMHAWSEVEHDLVYKPLSGKLSDEEYALLDQINGLVLTGEIALEQLKKAMVKRNQDSKNISDQYELTNVITDYLSKSYIEKLKLGNTENIYRIISSFKDNTIDTERIYKYLQQINDNEKETISDQLLDMAFIDLPSNYFRKNSKVLLGPDKEPSGFEHFVRTWIILEKVVKEINSQNSIQNTKYFVPKFENLVSLGFLSSEESSELSHYKQIRNQLLHGIETPSDEYLDDISQRLLEIAKKIIPHIENPTKRNDLQNELNKNNTK